VEFSVVIPTYNRCDVLRKTLTGLANQIIDPVEGPSPGFEVIVVDDGSTDSTQEYLRSTQPDFPVPLVCLRQNNRKQGAARNAGARKARGLSLVFLGDDTVPADDFLQQHMLTRLKDDPNVVVIGYTGWPPSFRPTRFMEYVGEEGWQFGFSLIDNPQDVPFNFLYTSNVSIDREFFLASGGFDEDFQEYGWEDVELSLRLQKMGMRLVFCPKAIAHHYHPTNLASFASRQRKVGFSAWTFFKMHPEMRDFLGVDKVPAYTLLDRWRMWLLTRACQLTERSSKVDLSRFYPDLMSYYYNLGILEGRHEAGR
jgi:glycosyltransferase involved in cell wall biosynthesis